MKTFKAFIKPFEAPQRSAKIKISVNFFSSSGIGRVRVKKKSTTDKTSKSIFPWGNFPLGGVTIFQREFLLGNLPWG